MNSSHSTPTVKCPECQSQVVWSSNNPHRPFCSEQCRNRDFIGWANEDKRIAGSASYADILSDDLPDAY